MSGMGSVTMRSPAFKPSVTRRDKPSVSATSTLRHDNVPTVGAGRVCRLARCRLDDRIGDEPA